MISIDFTSVDDVNEGNDSTDDIQQTRDDTTMQITANEIAYKSVSHIDV